MNTYLCIHFTNVCICMCVCMGVFQESDKFLAFSGVTLAGHTNWYWFSKHVDELRNSWDNPRNKKTGSTTEQSSQCLAADEMGKRWQESSRYPPSLCSIPCPHLCLSCIPICNTHTQHLSEYVSATMPVSKADCPMKHFLSFPKTQNFSFSELL